MALDPMTIQALREHRKRQNEEHLLVGSAWQRRQSDWRGEHRDDLVFTWPDGSLIDPQRLLKWFARHCEHAGLPPIRLHDVRHTYASAALANATGWHEMKLISLPRKRRDSCASAETAPTTPSEGAVPSVRIGRTIRIPRDALAATLGLDMDIVQEDAGDH